MSSTRTQHPYTATPYTGRLVLMRWERLFEDLSARADDQDRLERDALADDVRDEHWAQTSLLDVLPSAHAVDMAGAGRLSGRVTGLGSQMFCLETPSSEHLLSITAVRTLQVGSTRPDALPECRHRQILRQWARDGLPARVMDVDGTALEGGLRRIGTDFLMLSAGANVHAIPFAAISVISR